MKNTKLVLGLAVAVAVAGAGCGKGKGKVDSAQGAARVPSSLNNTSLADTMQHYASRVVTPTPWAGYWFPYTAAGIFGPATKYDTAYVQDLRARGVDTASYQPLAAWESANHGPSYYKLESWFGHCNGWSASAIMVPEPRAPKMIEGISFGVEDQKALLAESWLEFSGDFVGTRVNDKGDFSSAAFWDVVPAQFHLMMANLVGKENRSLILDRHTGHEIWNQPLVAYKFDEIRPQDYLGPHPQFPEIYRVNVTAHIWWANDNVEANEISPPFDMNALANEDYDHFYPGRVLHYELWLDGPVEFDTAGNIAKSGNILVTQENGRYVGGTWKNGTGPAVLVNSHPDYLWVPYGIQHSSGYKNPRIDDNWVRKNIADEERGR